VPLTPLGAQLGILVFEQLRVPSGDGGGVGVSPTARSASSLPSPDVYLNSAKTTKFCPARMNEPMNAGTTRSLQRMLNRDDLTNIDDPLVRRDD
jgi:hypothetical protein